MGNTSRSDPSQSYASLDPHQVRGIINEVDREMAKRIRAGNANKGTALAVLREIGVQLERIAPMDLMGAFDRLECDDA